MKQYFTFLKNPRSVIRTYTLKWSLALVGGILLFGFAVPFGILQTGISTPEPIGAFLNGNLPSEVPSSSSSWTHLNAYPNLTFTDPVDMREIPGSNKFLIAGKRGKLWTIDKDSTTNVKHVLLDIEDSVRTSGDAGLLGAILHPEFGQPSSPNRGYIYVFYRHKYQNSGQLAYNRLSRFTLKDGETTIHDSTEYVLIQQYDRQDWHNGGGMFFGPEGFLYLTIGDEGGANDQYNSGQKINDALLGGILRIDIDKNPLTSHPIIRQPNNPATPPSGWPSSFTQGYYIPNDNPWVDPTGNTLEEFYAIGLRSPHRMTYDEVTGNIWIGDIGQGSREEISIAHKGDNMQWPYKEGKINGPKTTPNPLIGADTPPVYDYPRSVGVCVIGGFVYRGTKWASSLGGKYIFGDHGVRNIWAMSNWDTNSPNVTFIDNIPAEGVGSKAGISHFATDSDGEIYVLKLYGTNQDGGKIYKLRPTVVTPEPPALLSQTGAFKNISTLEPQDGFIPYDLNVPFWSDGAAKSRWMAIPNNGTYNTAAEKISYSENGEWGFPIGTVMMKHFEMPVDESNPNVTRRLETRFLVHTNSNSYYGISYRWKEDGTDADLLAGSWTDTLSITTSNGPREVTWDYPGRDQCMTCHNEAASGVLGPKTRQLNGNFQYPGSGISANQLATLAHLEIFNTPPDTNNLGVLLTSRPSDDLSFSLGDRARSYLDANCASCHRPGNSIQANFDARLSTPLNEQKMVYGEIHGNLGVEGSREVVPQDLEHSMMYQRISAVHKTHAMPPLAKNKLDTAGVELIADWINSLNQQGTGTSSSIVATYSTDFQGPTPAAGWAYLGNFNGAIGNSSNYAAFQYNGTSYDTDGNPGVPDGGNLSWGHLASGGGHTGPSTSQGQAQDRYVIAAFTVSQAGDFEIVNSNLTDANGGCGDGAVIRVYVNNSLKISGSFPNGGSTAFNGSLGTLQSGDVIYAAVGPGSTDGCDSFSWDYEIERTNSATYQRIDFQPIANTTVGGEPISLSSSASSGLPVSYSVASGPATISGSILTLTGQPGQVVVQASQSGNGTFEAAPTVAQSFWITPVGSGQGTGLLGTYFNEMDFTDIAFFRNDPTIDFYWGGGSPGPSMEYNTYSVVWEGEIEVPYTETVTFTTSTDDGVRLYVDNVLVVNYWNDQDVTSHSGSIALNAFQRVPIRMEFYEKGVYASAELSWSSSSIPTQIVPTIFMYPAIASSFPVELLSFDAVLEDEQVNINWITGSEINTDYFFVERGVDTVSFESIAKVEAAGNSTQEIYYETIDPFPFSGISYYRLKQVDIDGSTAYSEVKSVNIQKHRLRLYPNPLTNGAPLRLETHWTKVETGQIILLDTQGRIIKKEELSIPKGKQIKEIDLGSLAPGIYLLLVETDNEQILEKIMIK